MVSSSWSFALVSSSWSLRLGVSPWSLRFGLFALPSSYWSLRLGLFLFVSTSWSIPFGLFVWVSPFWPLRFGIFLCFGIFASVSSSLSLCVGLFVLIFSCWPLPLCLFLLVSSPGSLPLGLFPPSCFHRARFCVSSPTVYSRSVKFNRPLSRRLDRCDRVIQNESRYPFGGNVYYVTMQITFPTRKFRNEERNLHCDVVHITTKWVSSLTLDCNGVFAIKASGIRPTSPIRPPTLRNITSSNVER